MKREDMKRIKNMVSEDGYTPVIAYERLPLNDQIVDLIYEDMDGNASFCKAYFKSDPFGKKSFIGIGSGVDGYRMAYVVAWKANKLEFKKSEE